MWRDAANECGPARYNSEECFLGESQLNDTKPPDAPIQAPSVAEDLLNKPSAFSQIIQVLGKVQEVQATQADNMEKVVRWINAADAKRRRTLLFLSYRFNESSRAAVDQLQRLFRALDVDIVTGEEYEPRSVSDKIRARLDLPLDGVVLLVMNEESLWTRDEIAIAHAKSIPVIPLVAKGASFTAGVFGDLEMIYFDPGHVEQTFIGILEALRYIKLHRRPQPPRTGRDAHDPPAPVGNG